MRPKLYAFVDNFPAPRKTRVKWLRVCCDVHYRRAMHAAFAAGRGMAGAQPILDEWNREDGLLQDEEHWLYSDWLLDQARKLKVPTPLQHEPKSSTLSPNWVITDITNIPILSAKGVVKIREDIRIEQRWRMEKRAHWFSFVATVAAPV